MVFIWTPSRDQRVTVHRLQILNSQITRQKGLFGVPLHFGIHFKMQFEVWLDECPTQTAAYAC